MPVNCFIATPVNNAHLTAVNGSTRDGNVRLDLLRDHTLAEVPQAQLDVAPQVGHGAGRRGQARRDLISEPVNDELAVASIGHRGAASPEGP